MTPAPVSRVVHEATADDVLAAEARDERLLFWGTQAVLFLLLVVGVLFVMPSLEDAFSSDVSVTGLLITRMGTLAGVAALLRWGYRLPAVERLRGVPLVATVLVICLVGALTELAAFQLVVWSVLPGSRGFVERYPAMAIFSRFIICLIWTATYFLLHQRAVARRHALAAATSELRAAQAEVALRESELTRLGQQIEPHFLFNALSAVLACRHDAESVEAVTTSLSDYLRFCLARGGEPEPLALELDAIEQLLSVHEARFGEDLDCSVASSPAARRVHVPPLVLAPLVDNALKYARQTSPTPWRVEVTAQVVGEQLVIEVANNGCWVDPDPHRSGSGLANLRRRLELSGIAYDLGYEARDGLVRVRLTLPVSSPEHGVPRVPPSHEPA